MTKIAQYTRSKTLQAALQKYFLQVTVSMLCVQVQRFADPALGLQHIHIQHLLPVDPAHHYCAIGAAIRQAVGVAHTEAHGKAKRFTQQWEKLKFKTGLRTYKTKGRTIKALVAQHSITFTFPDTLAPYMAYFPKYCGTGKARARAQLAMVRRAKYLFTKASKVSTIPTTWQYNSIRRKRAIAKSNAPTDKRLKHTATHPSR